MKHIMLVPSAAQSLSPSAPKNGANDKPSITDCPSSRPDLLSPPLQRRCNSVSGNVANGRAEPGGRMSNERFIQLGQRCGNGLGMPSQGQNVGTDRQSPYPLSSPEETQLAPEVTTGRVGRSGVTVRSPALLFSFIQRNKKVPMPEDGHKQNRLCRARKH